MTNTIRYFTRHLFDRESTEDIELHEIDELIARFPFFTPAHLIKEQVLAREQESSTGYSALFFNNHLWYEHLLAGHERFEGVEPSLLPENAIEVVHEVVAEAIPEVIKEVSTNQPADTPETQPAVQLNITAAEVVPDNAPIAFEPYHTIDYFASQGIKLAPNDLSKDKFGQQLKSFTEWLRSMKRLPAAEAAVVSDESGQQIVVKAAEHSIEEKEVLTEAMAEVWIKQGNNQKAIEVYHKLSLMNSAKRSYFASKIDELKST